ncbi:hypothetical protein VTK73DRAFT_9872 [Phialemonium thermophilum]|uniref:C2H2-type domain-containing protein n=1 Tax=Phialemonium thermophilum TaxID=223376 RepID=A0ABR3VZW4_9PEZI
MANDSEMYGHSEENNHWNPFRASQPPQPPQTNPFRYPANGPAGSHPVHPLSGGRGGQPPYPLPGPAHFVAPFPFVADHYAHAARHPVQFSAQHHPGGGESLMAMHSYSAPLPAPPTGPPTAPPTPPHQEYFHHHGHPVHQQQQQHQQHPHQHHHQHQHQQQQHQQQPSHHHIAPWHAQAPIPPIQEMYSIQPVPAPPPQPQPQPPPRQQQHQPYAHDPLPRMFHPAPIRPRLSPSVIEHPATATAAGQNITNTTGAAVAAATTTATAPPTPLTNYDFIQSDPWLTSSPVPGQPNVPFAAMDPRTAPPPPPPPPPSPWHMGTEPTAPNLAAALNGGGAATTAHRMNNVLVPVEKQRRRKPGKSAEADGKERRYKCDVDGCPSAFQKQGHLRRHKILVHTSRVKYLDSRWLSPYSCDFCDATIKRLSDFRAHLGSHACKEDGIRRKVPYHPDAERVLQIMRRRPRPTTISPEEEEALRAQTLRQSQPQAQEQQQLAQQEPQVADGFQHQRVNGVEVVDGVEQQQQQQQQRDPQLPEPQLMEGGEVVMDGAEDPLAWEKEQAREALETLEAQESREAREAREIREFREALEMAEVLDVREAPPLPRSPVVQDTPESLESPEGMRLDWTLVTPDSMEGL